MEIDKLRSLPHTAGKRLCFKSRKIRSSKIPALDLTKAYDLLVIGGGNAALCAAMTAQEAGAKVLLLESAPKDFRGGNSRHTRNLRYAHDQADHLFTGAYTEEEFWDDLLRVTNGQTDEDLARLTIQQSKDLGRWMNRHGCHFQPSMRGTLHLSRTNAFFLGGGKALINAYYARAVQLGVDVIYNAEVIDLSIENSRFLEASVRQGEERFTAQAKALVVASGGFQANLEWLREYWGDSARNFIVRGSPYDQGTMLRILLNNGAMPQGDPTQCHAVAIDARAPKFDGGIVTRLDCVPFGIVVNKEGRRFYDEGQDFWPKRYAIWGRLVAQQPDQTAYSIIDAKSNDLFMPSVHPPIEAESVRELAWKIDLKPENLEDAIQAFNASVQTGRFDPERLDECRTVGLNPPKSHWARPLDCFPLSAYPLKPGITFTYLSVRVNKKAQVIMDNEQPAENIFAAGEIMAGNILGQGYMAGFGMTIGTVFGRLAGQEAASYVLR